MARSKRHGSQSNLPHPVAPESSKKRRRSVHHDEGQNVSSNPDNACEQGDENNKHGKKKPEKRRKKKGKQLKRHYRLDVAASVRSDEMLAEVLQRLDREVQSLRDVFNPQAWLPNLSNEPVARITPPAPSAALPQPTPNPTVDPKAPRHVYRLGHSDASFESALASLDHGVKILEHAATGLATAYSPSCTLTEPTGPQTTDTTAQPSFSPRRRKTPRKKQPLVSPYFEQPEKAAKKQTAKTSPHFETDPFSEKPTPEGLCFTLRPSRYGLIQERICGDLFALVVQAILWNQTTAKAGRPVLFSLLSRYPTPEKLAAAEEEDVLDMIRCLGLQRIRSRRLILVAQAWVAAPPCPSRRYGKRHYPQSGDGRDTWDGEMLGVDDERTGWEIAHLPGIGPYALDSFRIFYRDTLRGVKEGDGTEPEWQRVIPEDKDLRPYLVWRWKQEGWQWDPKTGSKKRI